MSAFRPRPPRPQADTDIVKLDLFNLVLELVNSGVITSESQIYQFVSPEFNEYSELTPYIIYKNKRLTKDNFIKGTLSNKNYEALKEILRLKLLNEKENESLECFNTALKLLGESRLNSADIRSLTDSMRVKRVISEGIQFFRDDEVDPDIGLKIFILECRRKGIKNPIITDEQASVLEIIRDDNNSFREEKFEKERDKEVFDLIFELIAKNKISKEEQIYQFVNPKFVGSLLSPRIKGFRNGQPLGLYELGTSKISKETADGFIQTFKFLKSLFTPKILKQALIDNYSAITTLKDDYFEEILRDNKKFQEPFNRIVNFIKIKKRGFVARELIYENLKNNMFDDVPEDLNVSYSNGEIDSDVFLKLGNFYQDKLFEKLFNDLNSFRINMKSFESIIQSLSLIRKTDRPDRVVRTNYIESEYCNLIITSFRSQVLEIDDSNKLTSLYQSILSYLTPIEDRSLISNLRINLQTTYESALRNLQEILKFTESRSVVEFNEGESRNGASEGKDSFRHISALYRNCAQTLFHVLQQDKAYSSLIDDVLEEARVLQVRLREIQKQRTLTEEEIDYIKSIQRLSLINPALVALARSNPDVTRMYLRDHFNRISTRITERIQDGDYIPLIHIGLGPNGTAAIAKIAELESLLSQDMLCIDGAENVGGPFGVPGNSWKLNSANAQSGTKIVRASAIQGSLFGFNPGERVTVDGTSTRGDINSIIDWSATLSQTTPESRYATNEDLALLLSLQLSTISDRVALQTKVIKIEPNTEKSKKGDKIVTLEITSGSDVRIVRVYTDAIISATGLGDPTYGFEIQGRLADTVVSSGKENYPKNLKILTTLEAFKAAGAEGDFSEFSFGRTVVIYGGGDSALTLLERLGNLFSAGNISKSLASIQKIYVITDKSLAERPRYKQICDLLDRSGRESLVTIINNRVSDIEQSPDGKLNFYGRNGNLILLPEKGPITADTAIAATGFKNNFRAVLEDYDKLLDGDGALQTVNIQGFECGLRVPKDPTVLVVGVSANNQLGRNQLPLLPAGAQQALSRVPAGNAVAIGFNTGATGLAVADFIKTFEYIPTTTEDFSRPETSRVPENITLIPGEGNSFKPGEVETLPSYDQASVVDDLSRQDALLLLNAEFIQLFRNYASYTVGPIDLDGFFDLDGSFDFDLSLENGRITVKNLGKYPVYELLLSAIELTFLDYRVFSYFVTVIKNLKYDRPLRLHMEFLNGRLNPKTSFID